MTQTLAKANTVYHPHFRGIWCSRIHYSTNSTMSPEMHFHKVVQGCWEIKPRFRLCVGNSFLRHVH